MGSNRLPGKVMKEIEGKPLLFYVIKQTLSSKFINRVIISTSIAPEDKKIVDFCLNFKNLFWKILCCSSRLDINIKS